MSVCTGIAWYCANERLVEEVNTDNRSLGSIHHETGSHGSTGKCANLDRVDYTPIGLQWDKLGGAMRCTVDILPASGTRQKQAGRLRYLRRPCLRD